MNMPFDQAQQFTSLWMDFMTRMATAGFAAKPGETPPDAAKAVRQSVFDAMTQHTDSFMRSEQFLGMMRQSMEASIAFRRQLNDLLTQAHHSTQSVARPDVDSLMLSVRHLETRTLECMESLSMRLEEIGQRLAAVETAVGKVPENGHTKVRASGNVGEPAKMKE